MSHPSIRAIMAVGGGDAFSLSATLLTIILLWSLLQWTAPWWLRELSRSQSADIEKFRLLDRMLTLLPLILLGIVMIDLIWSHYTLDLTRAHVANYGGENFSVWQRIQASLFSEDAPWLAIPLFFSLSSIICEYWCGFDNSLFDGEIKANQRATTLRLHGLLWPFMLLAFMSSNSFAVYSQPLSIGEATLLSPSNAIFLFISGSSMAVWVHLTSRLAQQNIDILKQINQVVLVGILTLAPLLAFQGVLPKSGEWLLFSQSVALGNEATLALCASLAILLLGWPFFIFLLTRVHATRGQARERRWIGLLHIFCHTFFFTLLSGIIILEPLPNISSLSSAIWLSLTLMLPLAVAGLLGSLLPMAGLDARPRPEAWGFFLGMTVVIPFFTIREPLTAALVPGLFVSMAALPLLATHTEKRSNLSIRRRGFESATLLILSFLALYGFHLAMEGSYFGFIAGVLATIVVPTSALVFAKPIGKISEFGEEE
ncbi:MAG: hypothetical protein QF831_00060 [Candidatus Thalassarchaeaceae archaeon]|nr:hypothetical protein [Candidatus Thalassarchaeaceae archaeon]